MAIQFFLISKQILNSDIVHHSSKLLSVKKRVSKRPKFLNKN